MNQEDAKIYGDYYRHLKSKYSEFDPIYLALTQDKYIRFFNNPRRPKYANDIPIYSEFISLASDIFEIIRLENNLYGYNHPNPKELLIGIRKKYLTEKNYFTPHLKIFSSDKYINDFDLWEILALIWYSSCRNPILFETIIYAYCCDSGTVGRFLIRLKQIAEAEI